MCNKNVDILFSEQDEFLEELSSHQIRLKSKDLKA
jgi:hypothetical protein